MNAVHSGPAYDPGSSGRTETGNVIRPFPDPQQPKAAPLF